MTRWTGKEPNAYRHLVAGVVEAPLSGSQALAGELMCALDVSESNLIPVSGSDLR